MRKSPTPAEAALWDELRRSRLLGFRFRRQHVIAGWIVDFYCPELRLAIEVDGPVHDTNEDAARDEALFALGVEVLRVTNDQVERELEQVLERIRLICTRRKRSLVCR